MKATHVNHAKYDEINEFGVGSVVNLWLTTGHRRHSTQLKPDHKN